MRKAALLPFLLSAFLMTTPVFAQITTESSGLNATASSAFGPNYVNENNQNIATFVGLYVISPVFGLVALLSLIYFLYAGFLWLTSAGDDKKVKKAKDIMRDVVIGVVILAASYALVSTILKGLAPTVVAP